MTVHKAGGSFDNDIAGGAVGQMLNNREQGRVGC